MLWLQDPDPYCRESGVQIQESGSGITDNNDLPDAHLLRVGRRLQGDARETFRERGNQVLGQVSRGQENVRQVEKAGLQKLTN
jgi:hypothetical protein